MSYLIVFFTIWWPWMNFTWFASAYDTDDVVYRLLTFVQIAGVLVVAAGVPSAFDDLDFTIDGDRLRRSCASRSWPSGCGPPTRTRPGVPSRCGTPSGSRSSRSAVDRPPRHRSAVGGSRSHFLVLGLLELAVPAWAERAGPPDAVARRAHRRALRPVHDHRPRRVRPRDDDRRPGRARRPAASPAPLLAVAIGGLLLVFAPVVGLLQARPGDIGDRRLASGDAFVWGYGHYFVFAAVAALGAGLAGRHRHDSSATIQLADQQVGVRGGDPGGHLPGRGRAPARPAVEPSARRPARHRLGGHPGHGVRRGLAAACRPRSSAMSVVVAALVAFNVGLDAARASGPSRDRRHDRYSGRVVGPEEQRCRISPPTSRSWSGTRRRPRPTTRRPWPRSATPTGRWPGRSPASGSSATATSPRSRATIRAACRRARWNGWSAPRIAGS